MIEWWVTNHIENMARCVSVGSDGLCFDEGRMTGPGNGRTTKKIKIENDKEKKNEQKSQAMDETWSGCSDVMKRLLTMEIGYFVNFADRIPHIASIVVQIAIKNDDNNINLGWKIRWMYLIFRFILIFSLVEFLGRLFHVSWETNSCDFIDTPV